MFDRFVEIQRMWREALHAGWSAQRLVGEHALPFAVADNADETVCQSPDEDVARLIARAPGDVRWLLDEVQRLRDELEAATSSGEVVGKSRDGDITLAKFKLMRPEDDDK